MIQSGHTMRAAKQLANWYNAEYQNVKNDTYGDWELNEQGLERLLDTRIKVPFRDFMIRYLLYIHAGILMENGGTANEEEISGWVGKNARAIVSMIEQNADSRDEKDQDAAALLDKIVNHVFRDFEQNGYCRPARSHTKVYGSLSINSAVKWDKNDIREKITADSLKESEMYGFAFGLNMSYEDLDYFLKKAFFRPGFDLWKPEDLILFITFKYAKGDKYSFWRSMTAASEEIKKNAPQTNEEPDWMREESFSTATIRSKVDDLVKEVEGTHFVFSLDQDGGLPEEAAEFLRKYYSLIGAQEKYTRTGVKEMKTLLEKIEQNLEEEIDAANEVEKKPLHGDTEQNIINPDLVAQGNIHVYYQLKHGLFVPKGTAFYKYKDGRKVSFITRDEVKVSPCSEEPLINVELTLISEDTEPKKKNKEEMRFFIDKQSTFYCDNSALSDMENKSGFKGSEKKETVTIGDPKGGRQRTKQVKTPYKNIPLGEQVHTGGKITAMCREGETIEEGTRFWTFNSKKEKVYFRLEKTVEAAACKSIYVYCTEQDEETEKNTITECSLEKRKTKITKITNSKIGFKQRADGDGQDGGPLCNYLYPETAADWTFSDVLREDYLDKLGAVLEGTRITPSKISNIRNGKKVTITRSDLITFSFLAYASELKRIREERGDSNEKDFGRADVNDLRKKSRYSGFFLRTNKILVKCGYYELYQPNPYDALIIYLLSHNESIDALRNLWSWYLGKKKLLEKTQAE